MSNATTTPSKSGMSAIGSAILLELPRHDGTITRVERNADGTESVVSLYCGQELERYTRPARFGAARTVES